jgi:hypothetical protein
MSLLYYSFGCGLLPYFIELKTVIIARAIEHVENTISSIQKFKLTKFKMNT